MDHCEKCLRPLADGRACPVCGTLPAAPIHHLKPGTVLQGRYLIGRAFEETDRAITYTAKDLNENDFLAVQEYFPAGRAVRDHEKSAQIFGMEREQRALSRLGEKARILRRFREEPGVVAVSDVFEENNTVYLVMEQPGGVMLQTYLAKMGRISAQVLLSAMTPMLRTLQKLHESGLIHRRISPETIRLYADGTVKLVGFGVAGESLEKGGLKHGYAPAEQYELLDRSDPRSDVYSLCATIYAAITGNRLPAASQRSSGDLVEPSRYGADISPRQEAALLQGLEPQAERRLGSVKALMLAMDMVFEEAPEPAAPEVEELQETVEVAEEPIAEESSVEKEAPAEEPEAAEETVEEPAEEAEDEPDVFEEKSADRKGFSWKELLALAKVNEQDDAWDDFIETTLEKPKETPVDPVFGQGHAEPATVVVTPVPVTVPAEEPEPEEVPILQEELPEDQTSADAGFDADEPEEAPAVDKRLLGRRIAMGIMAVITVVGIICAIWMTKTAI